MNNYRNNNRKNRFKSNGDRNFRKRSLHIHKNQMSMAQTLSIGIEVQIVEILMQQN